MGRGASFLLVHLVVPRRRAWKEVSAKECSTKSPKKVPSPARTRISAFARRLSSIVQPAAVQNCGSRCTQASPVTAPVVTRTTTDVELELPQESAPSPLRQVSEVRV
eukprot:3195993-Prymnesium_polylepis.1